MNKVFLIGRLTKDPELRYTVSNVAIATFSLAVNRNFTNQNGEREADFINIQVWKKMAENCAKYLSKGSQIAIDGRIQTRTYDAQDGSKRYVTEVVAENIQFLDNKKDGQQNGQESRQEVLQSNMKVDPYEEMSRQVRLEDYSTIDEDDLPF